MPRRSIVFSDEEIEYLTWFARKKGMRHGIADLLSIALHSYIVRNKARGRIAPWDADDVEEEARARQPAARAVRTVRNAVTGESHDGGIA